MAGTETAENFPMTTWVNSNLDGIESSLDDATKEINKDIDKLDKLIEIINDPLGKAKEAAMAEAKVLCKQVQEKVKATTEEAAKNAAEVDANATAQKKTIDAQYQALLAIPTTIDPDPSAIVTAVLNGFQSIAQILGFDKILTQKTDSDVATLTKTAKLASIAQKTVALGQKAVSVASKASKIGITL